jgi:hypothetical protein
MHINTRKVVLTVVVSFVFAGAHPVSAAVIITEVMYDPVGTDAKHEWVEVYNDGSLSVDGTKLKLREGGTDHRLTATNGSSLGSGEYAVIADDPTAFKQDYPSYAGALFDSAFSLSNTGETLTVIDELNREESLAYDPTLGGAGTGASLQRTPDGFIGATPTPGEENATTPDEPEPEPGPVATSTGDGSSNGASSHGSTSGVSAYKPKEPFGLSIGRERLTTIHAPLLLKGETPSGVTVRYLWSFGDGARAKGRTVRHEYDEPGTYAVVGRAERSGQVAIDRTTVTVVEPSLGLEFATSTATSAPAMVIHNTGAHEINLGGWELIAETSAGRDLGRASVAEDTIVLPGGHVRLSLPKDVCEAVVLRYPDGTAYGRLGCGEAPGQVQ